MEKDQPSATDSVTPHAATDPARAQNPSSTVAADGKWTVRRILEWTTFFLKQKGVESPRLEAELLLAHARSCQRIHLYANFENEVPEEERTRMREMVQRRARREPLAYIVGSREFYGRSFEVAQGVLIPRPETETLIDVCLTYIAKDQPVHLIEIGFGSGCIAVTLARQRLKSQVTAIDSSPAAYEIAQRNVAAHSVADRVTLISGDCLEPLHKSENIYDGLVSNPPYIRTDEMPSLAPEVGLHEPREALVSGTDGLDLTRRIIADAARLLKPGAFLALELDPAQCAQVVGLLSESGFDGTQITKDLSGLDRIVHAVRSGTDGTKGAVSDGHVSG